MQSHRRSVAVLCGVVAISVVLPACLAVALVPNDIHRMKDVRSVSQAIDLFKKEGFDPQEALRDDTDVIPPVFVANLPQDLKNVSDTDLRKSVFVAIVLPHVLRANATIMASRKRLLRIVHAEKNGKPPGRRDRRWLERLADRYDTKPDDVTTLLHRVDIVPPSLAVAQAAQESGWGTSRFARVGNALFGQHADPGTATDAVAARKAEGVALHAFDTLYGSVKAYIHNLNTHAAYRRFRAMRAAMRREDKPLDSHKLAAALEPYSEEGAAYVNRLRTLMRMPAVAASKNIHLATAN